MEFQNSDAVSFRLWAEVLTRHISGDFVDAGEIHNFRATVLTLADHSIQQHPRV